MSRGSHFVRRGGGAAGYVVLVDAAALPHEDDAADGRDVSERVAVERDDVGLEAGRYGADAVAEAQRLRPERVGRDERRHRLDAAVPHALDELLGVAAVRAGQRVRAEDDLYIRN